MQLFTLVWPEKPSIEPRRDEDAVAEQQNANAGGEAVLDEPTEVVIHDEAVSSRSSST